MPVVVVLHAGDRPSGMSEVERAADVRYVEADGLGQALTDADALLMWDFTSRALADPELAATAAGLDWIHVAGAGVDRALVPQVVAGDVVVTNARGVFDAAIAEYVLGLVLLFAKDFPGTLDLQRERTWRHRETERIGGRTALVVGAGPIGRRIGTLLRAAGLRVHMVGRGARSADPDFGVVSAAADLQQYLPDADYVVLAAPLTPETEGMIDAAGLARMRTTARLINIGRGQLVVESDLIDALRAGQIAGAALDVFQTEPLPTDSPLWVLPGVVVSPHMSADFIGWLDALAAGFVENFRRWRAGEPLMNVVSKRLGYVPTDESPTE